MGKDHALTIGAMSRATGINIETIRYYERIGLLPLPPRTRSNYRAYTSAEQKRLNFVRRTRNLGFSIEEIRALLRLSDQRDTDCCEVTKIAQNHLVETERKITDLQALADELRLLIAGCSGGVSVENCRIIEVFSGT
jgi:DNA-binding transcriptional MerR regulator